MVTMRAPSCCGLSCSFKLVLHQGTDCVVFGTQAFGKPGEFLGVACASCRFHFPIEGGEPVCPELCRRRLQGMGDGRDGFDVAVSYVLLKPGQLCLGVGNIE